MSEHERPEIECPSCSGEGGFAKSVAVCCQRSNWECGASGCTGPIQEQELEMCPDCHGTGYRPATDDELADMAEAAWERAQEGEPPLSLDEQHRMAWEEKRRLRR